MKKIIIAGLLAFLSIESAYAAADYYLKIDGVEGETTKSAEGTSPLMVSGFGAVGQTFILDGTKSQDDQTVSRFLWRQAGGPVVKISNSATIKASFVPTVAGTYVFELVVTDSSGMTYTRQKSEFVVGNDAPSAGGTIAAPTPKPQEGNVEMNWKVEEGESLETKGIEPDEIDFNDDGEENASNFGVLLGGGSDDSEEAQKGRDEVAEILFQGMQEADRPVETLSINFEKIKVTVRQNIKLFGFISISADATVEIDAENQVKVKFPWWAFLAGDKNSEELGQQIFTTLSNVLKTKHDTVKNAIGNVR